MPQFYGHDYYLLAIAEHATRLNKAILAIPQALQKHSSHCCFNVLDTYSNGQEESLDFPKLDLPHFNSDILFVDEVQAETLEDYENNNRADYHGQEIIEIIPSSNPDSSCSWADSLEKRDDIINHQQPGCCEQFDSVKLSAESLQVLDEPVSVNNFRLAVLSLPSIPVLLCRLKAFPLEDPLLTPDGTKWEDADFQCLINTEDVCSNDVALVEESHMFTESFHRVSSNVNNDTNFQLFTEALLSYNDPSTEYEATAADIHNCDYIPAWNHLDHGGAIESDFLSQDNELVLSRLTSGFDEKNMVSRIDDDVRSDGTTSTTALSVLENFVKSADYHCQQDADNCGIHKCLSPFVEHRLVHPDNDDVLSQSVLEAPLDTLVAEEILCSKCSLLDGNFRTVEKHILEQDRHFDEICFSEPMLQEESLSSPILEASVCLALGLEDVAVGSQNLKWLFDVGQELDSLQELEVLSDDVCVLQLGDGETFEKFHTSELDFMFTCSTAHILNDDIQEATSAHMDSQTADVSEENQDFQLVDPLDSFIYVRARSVSNSIHVQHSPNYDMETGSKERQPTNALRSAAVSASNQQGAHIRTVAADFSGLWDNVLQCIIDCAGVYLEHMKQEALIPRQQKLMDISTDIIRFLLKERQKQLSDVISQDNADTDHTYSDSLLQSLAIVHVLRTAADLLLHACLESCITYLAANSEEKPAQVAKCCLEVHQQLFYHQCHFVKDNRRHPKLSVLINEVAKCCMELPTSQILVLVEKGLQSLVCAVESGLCQIPELTVLLVTDWKCVNTRQPRSTVFVASVAEARSEMLQLFTLVILYDERHNNHIKSWCQDTGISYTGLLTQYSCAADLTDKPATRMAQMSLVCSLEVTQYTQLVYLLETRYNIQLLERQYHKLCAPETKIYFADLILSSTHCIVLLAIEDLKGDWDLTAAITRFLALGLQFSHCCLILHGMDTGGSYVLENEVLSKIYKLTAALCNLTATSSSYVSYKVLISVTDEDVAACIRDIVDRVLAAQSQTNILTPWLSADPSQDEKILLQLSCMNSVSAQKLLHRLNVSEILEKPHGELTAMFPDIPDKVFKVLKKATFNLKCQQPHLSKHAHISCVTNVSPSHSHATRTLTHCSLSHNGETQVSRAATADLNNITRTATADLHNTTRAATGDFNNTTRTATADLNNTTRTATADLHNTTRAATGDFNNTTRAATADFNNTTRAATADFNNTTRAATADFNNTTRAATADLNNTTSVCQQPGPTKNVLHCSRTDMQSYSPVQSQISARHTDSNNLIAHQNDILIAREQRRQSVQHYSIPESGEQRRQSVQHYSIPESGEQRRQSVQHYSIPESGEQRRQSVQHYSIPESGEQRCQSVQQYSIPESGEQRCQSVQHYSIPESREQRRQSVQQYSIPESGEQRRQSVQHYSIPESREQRRQSVQQYSIPESGADSKVGFCSQSLGASGEHDEWEEQMCDYDHRKPVSGFLRPSHNDVSDSGSTAGAQLTNDLSGVCHYLKQFNQAATASNIPTCTDFQPNNSANNQLGLAKVCEFKYQSNTLQEYTTLRNGDESTTPGDDDRLQSFHTTIARAMHTLDIQTSNKSPACSLMFHRKYAAHSNYPPHMIDTSTWDTELTEAGQAPIVMQTETVSSLANTYGEYDHQDGSVFNFPLSDTRDKDVPSCGLALLHVPVKIEVEDMIYEHGRLNTSQQSTHLNTAQKPTYSFSNAGSFHMDNPSETGHITDQLKSSFLNSSVKLCDFVCTTNQTSAPHSHSNTTDAASFGLFSTKAQRHRDTLVDCGRQSTNYSTVTTSPCSTPGADLQHATQTDHCQKYSHSFLPAVAPPGTTANLQLLPFPVSKELRKHIKKHSTHDLHKPARFLAQGNHNSVRVSRQPRDVHKQIHFSHSDGMTASVHSQLRNPIQEELQNCTRASDIQNQNTNEDFDNCRRLDASLLETVGQIRHPITQQDIHSFSRQLDTSFHQNVGQMRNLKPQDFHNYAIEPNTSLLKNTSQTWNPVSSDCRQPTWGYSSHTTQPTWGYSSHTTQPTWGYSSHTTQPTWGYSSHTTQPSEIIACQQTHRTGTNLQVNGCHSFSSTCSTQVSTTSCAPALATSVARSSLLQHCPATTSSGGMITDVRAVLPYTPRHGVTVGLAQPFPRHNDSLETNEESLTEPTNEESTSYHPGSGLSHRAGQSPPMDLVADDDGKHCRDDHVTSDCYRNVKRTKWKQHLLSCQATQADTNKLATSNCSSRSSAGSPRVAWPTVNRNRKLQLGTREGNQGQTILVFR